MMKRFITLSICFFTAIILFAANSLSSSGGDYKAQLRELRSRCHLLKDATTADYFFFGMGRRMKMIYQHGRLSSLDGKTLIADFGEIASDTIMPDRYEVRIVKKSGERVTITENERGVYIGKKRVAGTNQHIELPSFVGKRYDRVLRVLLHEVLFNIQPDGCPLPNAEQYSRPFYRDAAYAMMVLKATGNENVMKPWVIGLNSVYDHARSDDYEESDNIGQALYIISPWQRKTKAFRQKLLNEAEKLKLTADNGKNYISGLVDGMTCPVYSTLWLIKGLRANGLDDSQWALPDTLDKYTDLCWMLPDRRSVMKEETYKDTYEWQTRRKNIRMYPYLNAARAHYYNDFKLAVMSTADYPLTWEQVWKDDGGHECRTHLWHAAELFLLIINQ